MTPMRATPCLIDMPEAPVLPGLRFRFYDSEDDIRAMAEVAQAANRANGETEHVNEDYLRVELRNPSHIPPERGVILALVHDRLVAFSTVEHSDTAAGDRHYRSLGNVHPDWRRHGLGTAMMAYNETLLRQVADEDQHPGARVLTTWIHDADVGGISLARRRGYRHVRVSHHMVRPDMQDIDVPPLPQGLELRAIKRAQLPQLWDGMIEAFRDHFGGIDGSSAAFRRWSEEPFMDLDLLVIAFEGQEMAGGVQATIDPGENQAQGYLRGWTDPVFTRRPWRRRGLAYALLGRALAALKERGMTSAQLGVDAQNPFQALSLYERHRFEVVRSASDWHKPLEP